MGIEPFWDVQQLVHSTVLVAQNPLDLYGPGRKELVSRWGEFLDVHRFRDTGDVDWGEVRTVLMRVEPQEWLTDRKFCIAVDSIFVELCGDAEGLKGTRTVLVRWQRYTK